MLTLVLTLAMLLSVMVVGAGAATFGDQESITNKEAVDVCTTLNIIGGYEDGTFRPTGNVTRAEMSKMICVALNGGQEPTMGSGLIATFNDVAKDHWAAPYIEYCVSQGIVGGVGGGNFNPTGNITGTQAAKMLLCILGYNASIQGYVGSDYWETNINVDAAQKGLYAGLTNLDASAPLTRDQAAQMIWNALNAYEVEYKTTLVAGPDGTLTSKVTVQDRWNSSLTAKITLLEDKYDAKIFVGDFKGDKNVISSGVKDGEIQVEGTGKYSGTATFPATLDLKYIGEEVKVLYKDNRTEGTTDKPDSKDAIYGVFVTGTTEVLNVTSDDIDGDFAATGGKIKVSGTEYDVKAAANSTDVIVKNNYGGIADTAAGGTTAADAAGIFKGLSKQNGDSVKFILKDGDVEMAYVVQSKLGTVTAVNSTNVTISGLGSIKIADNNVYSGIAKDDVVAYTRLYNKDDLEKAYVIVSKAETVSGTVDGFKAVSGGTSSSSVTMNNTTYKVYNEAAMPSNVGGEAGIDKFVADSHIGETVTLYLVNGYVAAAVQTSESANNYSLVVEVGGGSAGSALDPMKIVVLGADGNKTTLTVSDKGDTTIGVKDIVTYTGNSDNAKVSVKADASEAYDGSSDPVVNGYKTSAGVDGYDKTSKTFAGVVTTADCVLFRCTNAPAGTADDGDTYKASNIRDMKSFKVGTAADPGASTAAVTAQYTFVTDNDGKVVAVFVGNDTSAAANTSDMVIGIVSAKNDTVKVGDDTYNQYTVTSNSQTYTVKIEVSGDNGTTVVKGNIVAFAPSSDELYDNDDDFEVLSNDTAVTTLTDKVIDGTTYEYATVLVKDYIEKDGLVTYCTAPGSPDVDGAYTSPTGGGTLALADDCVIVYVNVKDDTAGEETGITKFDAQTGKYNAIILVNSDNVISHIVLETSGKDDVFAKNA